MPKLLSGHRAIEHTEAWALNSAPDCQRPVIELQPCGPRARRLTSCCEPAVDLGVDLFVPHVASELLHRLTDDGDSQHEALRRDRTEGQSC